MPPPWKVRMTSTALTLASAGPVRLRTPIVSIKGDRAFANSRDVAEFFGKQHAHVLRDIEKLITDTPAIASSFGAIVVPTKVGFGIRKDRAFDMDQKGFTMLAFGFTGAKANHFKLLYIDAFNAAMEEIQKLRSQAPAFALPQTMPEALRLAAEQMERAQVAEVKLIEAQPMLAVAESVVEKRRTRGLVDAHSGKTHGAEFTTDSWDEEQLSR